MFDIYKKKTRPFLYKKVALFLWALCSLKACAYGNAETDFESQQAYTVGEKVTVLGGMHAILSAVNELINGGGILKIHSYPGGSIAKFQQGLDQVLNTSMPPTALAEGILPNIALAEAQIGKLPFVSVTFSAGTLQVLDGLGPFLKERYPLIILAGGPSIDPTIDPAHSTTPPWSKLAITDTDERVAKALRILFYDIKPSQDSNPLELFQDAITKALLERKPVLISIRSEVLFREAIMPIPIDGNKIKKSVELIKQQNLSAKATQTALKLVKPHTKSVVVVGEGVPGRLIPLIVELMDHGIYVASTWGGQGRIPSDHPRYLGPYNGALSLPILPDTNRWVEGADFVVLLGHPPTNFVLNSGVNSVSWNKNGRSITTVNAQESFPNGEDIEIYLKQLLESLKAKGPSNTNEVPSFSAQVLSTYSDDLLPQRITRKTFHIVMSHFLMQSDHPKPFTLLVDPGTSWFAAANIVIKGMFSKLSNWTYGRTGIAQGQAMGIAMSTDQIPLVISGDGGFFQNGLNVLANGVSFKKHMIFIVFRDGANTMGKPEVLTNAEAALLEEVNLYDVAKGRDLSAIAKGIGATTYKPETYAQLLAALDEAERTQAVHVIEIPTLKPSEDRPEAMIVYYQLLKQIYDAANKQKLSN